MSASPSSLAAARAHVDSLQTEWETARRQLIRDTFTAAAAHMPVDTIEVPLNDDADPAFETKGLGMFVALDGIPVRAALAACGGWCSGTTRVPGLDGHFLNVRLDLIRDYAESAR